MNGKDKLLLIDGHNLLFKMFFGMPTRIVNASGKAIGCVVGYVGALRKIMSLVNPTHVAVVFDGERGSKRRDVYADYKANRTDYGVVPQEDNPFVQLPFVYKALEYMNVKYCETQFCEADDVIDGCVKQFGDRAQIVICSFDSDYFQLVGEGVSVLRYRGKCSTVCDAEFVKEKFGVEPRHYALFKSLVGDASDNIDGVCGIGVKTAAKLVNRYRTAENLLACADSIESEKLRLTVQGNVEKIKRNMSLICLDGQTAPPFSYADTRFTESGYKTMEVIGAIGL
ncbi:MAG: 5'-3' exonuclease [Corallococcus sp.]|nr:5'-3' exonuclease [Corallococcus sp.]